MATEIVFPNAVRIADNLTVTGDILPARDRSSMLQEDNAVYSIPLTEFRVHDAMHTNLPGTAATDDLSLISGTLGTSHPAIQTGDLKAAGATTRYARCQIALPIEYTAGQTVSLRAAASAVTTVSDGTMTLDFQVYKIDRDNTVSADLCATAATDINSLTVSDKTFTITATSLAPGDLLDVRMAIAVSDAASATAVIGQVAALELLCDVKA